MRKETVINFIVKLGHYPFDCMISFGETDVEVYKKLKKFNIDVSDNSKWKFEENGVGRIIMFPGGQFLLRLKDIPKTPEQYGYLQHEIFHVVTYLMKRFRMKLCTKNEEAYAYMIQHLTEVIYDKLHPSNMGTSKGSPNSKNLQEPDDKGNNSHNIENGFELSVHRQVSVDKPQE